MATDKLSDVTIRNAKAADSPSAWPMAGVSTWRSPRPGESSGVGGDALRTGSGAAGDVHDVVGARSLEIGEHLNATDVYLRLAFKAQAQCRATLEALSEIKNLRPVAFVKQANIANGPQQVNNGASQEMTPSARAPAPAPAPAENPNQARTELLEASPDAMPDRTRTRPVGDRVATGGAVGSQG